MKCESIPETVEAVQYLPGKVVPGVFKEVNGDRFYVVNAQGDKVFVNFGQWIITELDGIHHYSLDDNIFHKKYKVPSGQTEKEDKEILTEFKSKTVHTGKVSAATANTIRFDSEASSDAEAYKNHTVVVNTGTTTQSRGIIAYNASIKTATVDKDWDSVPTGESVFKIEKIEEVLVKKEEPKKVEPKKEEIKK